MRENPIRDYRKLNVLFRISEEFVRFNHYHDDRNSEGKQKKNPFWKRKLSIFIIRRP